jgi:LPXTG-motif cell wall-anchored protein
MLPCYHPVTGNFLLALAGLLMLGLAVLVVVFRRRDHLVRTAAFLLGGFLVIAAFVLWLGSYARSPLPFARQPALRGFTVVQRERPPRQLVSGEGFSMSYGSVAAINLTLEPAAASCIWQSQQGAEIDLPDICDIAYAAPPAEYDRLQVRVKSACGLPVSVGYLNVQILAP